MYLYRFGYLLYILSLFVTACLFLQCLPTISFLMIWFTSFSPPRTSIGGRNGKKVKIPREELHTCHKKAVKMRPELTREPSAIDVDKVGTRKFDPSMSDLPELEDYYNNVDENNRLLRSKER